MASPQRRKIALVGASGNVGSHILPALLEKNVHTITAIQRPESSAAFPDEVTVKKGALDDEAFLVESLKGQQVLIIMLGIGATGLQEGIVRAAAKAGVEYVLPVEFGSDPVAKLVDDIPLIAGKRGVRNLIEELGVSSWIAAITNPWLHYCLASSLFGFQIAQRKATFINGGNAKFSTSSFGRVGAAVAGLLSLPDKDLAEYKNKAFYIESFNITQRELFESILRVTKTTEKDWTVKLTDTETIQKEEGEAFKKGDMSAFYTVFLELHLREGYGGDFHHKVDLARFNFQQEDLDKVVELAVQDTQA